MLQRRLWGKTPQASSVSRNRSRYIFSYTRNGFCSSIVSMPRLFQRRRSLPVCIHAIFRNFGPKAGLAFAALLITSIALQAQGIRQTRALIHENIDETKLVTLGGNTRPEATAANDLGPVSDDLPLSHMLLQLRRPAQVEASVEQLIGELHDPKSAHFHQWLSAAEFGNNYGLAQPDIDAITGWLEAHGFAINSVYPSGTVIDFSGTAGQVRAAFHTTIHNLKVKGVHHIANFSDPEIPQALAPAVVGIVSLHDFTPHQMARPKFTFMFEGFTNWAVVPADLATIYDFNPLFSKGITGAGQTIAVVEDTNLFSSEDWTTFRETFGLAQYTSGSLVTEHPAPLSGTNNCEDPGVNPNDIEATLDAEWASAAAPNAAIVVAACADTTTFGVMTATQNLVNESKHPAIISISYGVCEAYNGAASNAAINTLYQQAVAEGISIFTAAGDEGAASCDANEPTATHGISVSALSSSPNDVAVGGTDFGDTYNGTNSMYWSNTNSATYGSALSYIPEIPWNGSCAGSLVSSYLGFSTPYGRGGFCASSTAMQFGLVEVVGSSGGPSNCATGVPAIYGVASGTCRGYAKPSWQTGLSGIAKDGVRDIPDVSMFASNGLWGHYAIMCFSDESNGGTPCTGDPSNWSGIGGTSIASPVMAGVQALVNQSTASSQGNPNYVYYALAAKVPSVFHAVTTGDSTVNCGGTENCYGIVGTLDYGRDGRVFGTTYGGALSMSSTSYLPAYAAGSAWNFATGIGSVDVTNLVQNWAKGQ
jgi:subtilase family serine protease